MNNEIEIGTVDLYYDEKGSFVSATFKAEPLDTDKDALLDRLKFTDGTSEDAIQSQAQVILAAWFSRMNHIELADREKYQIVTEVVECSRRSNDWTIQRCTLRFILKEINHETITPLVN